MTLVDATHAVLRAVEAQDLAALSSALDQRAQAIAATKDPGALKAAFEEGERACGELQILKQRWAQENSKLGQLRSGFGQPASPTEPDLLLHG